MLRSFSAYKPRPRNLHGPNMTALRRSMRFVRTSEPGIRGRHRLDSAHAVTAPRAPSPGAKRGALRDGADRTRYERARWRAQYAPRRVSQSRADRRGHAAQRGEQTRGGAPIVLHHETSNTIEFIGMPSADITLRTMLWRLGGTRRVEVSRRGRSVRSAVRSLPASRAVRLGRQPGCGPKRIDRDAARYVTAAHDK